MPSFLAEYTLVLIDIRVKNCIKIYMHEISEIGCIGTCYGVYRLIRISHGIEECIERSLYKLHKRILELEFPGSAEYGMLKNVGNSRRIRRRCSECNREDLIGIIIYYKCDPCSGLLVYHAVSDRSNILKVVFFEYFITFKLFKFHI